MQPLNPDDPKQIGPYTLIGRLGSGGMGVVFLATKESETVALKVVRASFLDDKSLRARFIREVELLRSIKTPAIAQIVDANVENNPAWLAVEFINGPDLKRRVDDKGPLSEENWFVLAEGLLTALDSIHKSKIIHRDIKPSNILDSEAGFKLIDFGIAQITDATSLTSTGLVAGSPAWLSPEQLHGTPLTFATDLFSAGSVLKFAATGISPWGDQTSTTTPVVFNRILNQEPDLSSLTDKQKLLVSQLLEKDPQKRITAQGALKLLKEIRGGQTTPTFTESLKAETDEVDFSQSESREVFYGIHPRNLVIFSILTLGFFDVIFFYKAWKHIKKIEKSDISPFWRAIFLIFFCHDYFERVIGEAHSRQYQTKLKSGFVAFSYIVPIITANLSGLIGDFNSTLGYVAIAFGFVSVIPIYLIQKTAVLVNNQQNEINSKANSSVGKVSLVGTFIGGIFITLLGIIIFFGDDEEEVVSVPQVEVTQTQDQVDTTESLITESYSNNISGESMAPESKLYEIEFREISSSGWSDNAEVNKEILELDLQILSGADWVYGACFISREVQAIRAEGKSIQFQIFDDGGWATIFASARKNNWSRYTKFSTCSDGSEEWEFYDPDFVLNLENYINTCVKYRIVKPKTSAYLRATREWCVAVS